MLRAIIYAIVALLGLWIATALGIAIDLGFIFAFVFGLVFGVLGMLLRVRRKTNANTQRVQDDTDFSA